ncbi:MAG: type II toxin-antitoxin system Phd/YefM family antitoxin [Geminicoccaceae bacterium]
MARKAAQRVTRVPLTKARHNLGAIIKQVHVDKEYFVLEKDGMPVAGLMDIDEFEDYLESRDEEMKRIVAESRREHLEGKSFPAEDLIEELQKEAHRSRRSTRAKLQDA